MGLNTNTDQNQIWNSTNMHLWLKSTPPLPTHTTRMFEPLISIYLIQQNKTESKI